MSYIGQGLPADTFQGFVTDSFTGDGSATTFTLSKEPFSEDTLIVVINNVIQKPTTNFTVSGTTLTIVGTAVASGDVIYAIHMGGPLPIGSASALDATTACTITTDDTSDTLTLTSTEAGADNAPILKMYRNSSSPADSDYGGLIKYVMRNDNSQDFIAAQHYGYNADVSDGTEDGGFAIDVMKAGTVRSILTATGDEAVFNNGSQDIDFRVESDNSTKAFFVNGTKGHCHISGASSATKVMSYSGGMGSLQLGVGGGIYSYDYNPVDGPYIANNAYSDDGTERYVGSGHAGRLGIYTGILLFHNAGNGSADGTISYNERFRIAQNGDITATDTSIGSNSDERLKENIKDFTYDVDKFKQFKPKTFDWKNPELHNGLSGNRGFIAQEIETVDDYYINKEELILRETEKTGDADYNLIPKDEDGKRISYTSKFGKKDAMYISVIQQLISRIEALEDA